MFHQGKYVSSRERNEKHSLNVHYITLFKSPKDRQKISMLVRQVNPCRIQKFMKSYEKATSRAHGYLILDPINMQNCENRIEPNESDDCTIKRRCIILNLNIPLKNKLSVLKDEAKQPGQTTTSKPAREDHVLRKKKIK